MKERYSIVKISELPKVEKYKEFSVRRYSKDNKLVLIGFKINPDLFSDVILEEIAGKKVFNGKEVLQLHLILPKEVTNNWLDETV